MKTKKWLLPIVGLLAFIATVFLTVFAFATDVESVHGQIVHEVAKYPLPDGEGDATRDWVVCCVPDSPKRTFYTQSHSGGNPCKYYQQTNTVCILCGYYYERGPFVYMGTHYPCDYT